MNVDDRNSRPKSVGWIDQKCGRLLAMYYVHHITKVNSD